MEGNIKERNEGKGKGRIYYGKKLKVKTEQKENVGEKS